MTTTLPAADLWPDFLESPPALKQRSTAAGWRQFREVIIPLHREDRFQQWWKANAAPMVRLGWWTNNFQGRLSIQQWLTLEGNLTDIGLARIARMDAPKQGALPLVDETLVLDPLPHGLEDKLRGYQVEPARQLYRALTHGPAEWGYPGAVDLSDMGTGKTYMALAAAAATGRAIIVLCPVVGRGGWERAFAHFGIDPEFIGTYEGLRGGNRPHVAALNLDGSFTWKKADEIILILDEAQALRHDETLNVRLCSAAIKQRVPIIVASATVAISPLEMRFAGRITGLHSGGDDWARFLVKHGCSRKTKDSPWKWDGDTRHLVAIHNRLFPRKGCRVRKEELGSECPETEINVLPIKCSESLAIEKKWQQTIEITERLAKQGQNGRAAMLERKARMQIWQMAEAALVSHVVEFVKKDLAAGRSVAIFCQFKNTRAQLSKLLNSTPGFYGGISQKQRELWEKEFQANRLHLLISNMKAGGASVSLHDEHGERPRTAYIFPTDFVVPFEQATGRMDRVGGKSKSLQWIPCVAGTLSEKMVHRTRRKMLAISQLNNGREGKARF